jgi:hypothetical protein
VKEVNRDTKIAKLVQTDVNWTTEARYGVFRLLPKFRSLTKQIQRLHVRLEFRSAQTITDSHRDVNALQTHRIREIRSSPILAYYGRALTTDSYILQQFS